MTPGDSDSEKPDGPGPDDSVPNGPGPNGPDGSGPNGSGPDGVGGVGGRRGILGLAREALLECKTAAGLDAAKAAFVGKKGRITAMMKTLPGLPAERRPAFGAEVNRLRGEFEKMLAARREALRAESIARRLADERLDVSLPGRAAGPGGIHPINLALSRATDIFAAMGFEVADGPEIEDDHHNFTALNHPRDHPARSMHDTFYVRDSGGLLLRTHTSPVQIRHMRGGEPPFRAVAPGRVFRVDHDATHSPMFHQIEGLWVDESVTFAGLKGVLASFFRSFFGDEKITARFRPSFFPFTEPSAECDIFRDGRWLEICGCGMVHPNVLRAAEVDPKKFRGFAFGMGVERLAMLLYGVRDIRLFFENDLRFLSQFPAA